MKISIVTICFNNECDIRETIESVLSQTYQDIEYIIKDGGSTDGTMAIVKEYRERISKVISAPDEGLYDALNQGLQAATGDVVGMIHAGDQLHDIHVLEDIAHFFETNDVEVMYGNSRVVNVEGKTVRINKSPEYSKRLVRWGWMASHQSIYVRREVLERFGYYSMNVGGSGDYEWFVKYFYKHADEIHIKRNNRFIIRFSLGGQSTKSKRARVGKKNRDILRQCWLNNGLKPPVALPYRKFFWTLRQFVLAKME